MRASSSAWPPCPLRQDKNLYPSRPCSKSTSSRKLSLNSPTPISTVYTLFCPAQPPTEGHDKVGQASYGFIASPQSTTSYAMSFPHSRAYPRAGAPGLQKETANPEGECHERGPFSQPSHYPFLYSPGTLLTFPALDPRTRVTSPFFKAPGERGSCTQFRRQPNLLCFSQNPLAPRPLPVLSS